jgi:predicted AlkP superfamily pyrophosphatase or phosphodiesterase
MKAKILGFALLCIGSNLSAQSTPAKASPKAQSPKLVVGIVVDQMRYDYIYRYWSKYGNDGFKKLVGEGFNCSNTNYNYVPTYTAPGHASVYTGTTPAVHGIISNDWFDRTKGKHVYCVEDRQVQGVGTSANEGKRSPQNCLSSTITDQLRLSNNMKSRVFGVALKDRSAILPAGHAANAAYWFDGSSGNFISSTWYMQELPKWAQDFNAKKLADKYLSQPWNTLLPIEQYTESLPDDNKYEYVPKGETKPVFPHNLPETAKLNGGPGFIRSTPFGNTITKDFAIAIMQNENLGRGAATDFLAISFSSPDYIGHAYGPNSIEQEDNFLRLDKDLAELIAAIEAQVGKGNALIFLTADHAAPEVPAYLKDLKIPAGYVDEGMMLDSLKRYLKANYGDTLVTSFSNQQIFLDHRSLEAKKLMLQQVQDDIAQFMQRMTDVAEVMTAYTMNNTQFTEGPRYLMQKGYNAKRSGDVLVNYLPGYVDYNPTGTTHGSPYSYDTHVPLLFYGWNIKKGSSAEHVNITDIAPTIALMLNIQFPNGCTGKPISFLVK